jgi:hypothetical protein
VRWSNTAKVEYRARDEKWVPAAPGATSVVCGADATLHRSQPGAACRLQGNVRRGVAEQAKAACLPRARTPRLRALFPSAASFRLQGAAGHQRRLCHGELQPQIRASNTESEHRRGVDASVASAARARHRRLPPNRVRVPVATIRRAAVVEADCSDNAGRTGRRLLLLRVGRGA